METKNSKQGRKEDNSKIAAGQDYEVNYEKDKMKVSGEAVKKAIKSEGNSRAKVEKKLKK